MYNNRIPCKNEDCKGTILPTTAEKTGGLCMPCYQSIKRKEEEEYILKNRKDINLYDGIEDPVEILKIMYSLKAYDPLVNYISYTKSQEEIYNSLTEIDIKRLKEYAIQLISDDDIDTAEEILTRLVCFNNAKIEECLEFLIKKGHFYPEIIFKGASPRMRDALISRVGSDEGNRYHILLALSWIGDTVVANLFKEWHRNPPAWKRGLPPEDYSFEAGWRLNVDGKRKDLFYSGCYPLMHATQRDSGPLHIIESHEDNCPWCKTQMTTLFDFDLMDPVFQFFDLKGTRLRISTCHICTCFGFVYTKIDFNGSSKWHTANKRPKYLPDISNPQEESLEVFRPLTLSKVIRDPYYAARWVLEVPASQVGGHPTWIQDAEYPICPECLKHMNFIGQLDCPDFEEFGEGIYYAFLCKKCKTAATHFQQT